MKCLEPRAICAQADMLSPVQFLEREQFCRQPGRTRREGILKPDTLSGVDCCQTVTQRLPLFQLSTPSSLSIPTPLSPRPQPNPLRDVSLQMKASPIPLGNFNPVLHFNPHTAYYPTLERYDGESNHICISHMDPCGLGYPSANQRTTSDIAHTSDHR